MSLLLNKNSIDALITAAYDYGWQFPLTRKMHVSEVFMSKMFRKTIGNILRNLRAPGRSIVVSAITDIAASVYSEKSRNMFVADIWRSDEFHEIVYKALNIV